MNATEFQKIYEEMNPLDKEEFIKNNKQELQEYILQEFTPEEITLMPYNKEQLFQELRKRGENPLDYLDVNIDNIKNWYDDYLRQIQ